MEAVGSVCGRLPCLPCLDVTVRFRGSSEDRALWTEGQENADGVKASVDPTLPFD